MLLSGFASFWTERLWFKSVDYGDVFTTLLLTRIGLFFVFAGLMAATVAVTMAMAYRFRPVLWPGMPGMPDDGMDRYRELLAPRMTWVIAGVAVVMGLFAGGSATVATWCCSSSVIPGNSGSVRISPAAASASGKSPAEWPRWANAPWRWIGTG